MQRRVWRTIIATLLASSAACVGTSTGNPITPPQREPGGVANTDEGSQCESTPSELGSLDAVSPLGFSAADMLALAEGPIEVDLQWPQLPSVQYGPESGTSKLLLEITPRGSKARFKERNPKASSGGAEIGLGRPEPGGDQCPDQVELDVSVHFKTSGRAFDESFDATLIAHTARFARIYQQLPAAKLQGEFDAQLADMRSELDSLQFTMAFSELGPTGSIGLGLTIGEPSSGNAASRAATQLPFARWPAGATCRDGIDSSLDRKLGAFTARDGIQLINRAGLQLVAANATRTPLSLQFTAAGDKICVSELDGAASQPSMLVSGTLRVRTDDQQIDGTWPVQLTVASTADGQLKQAELSYDRNGGIVGLMVAADAFEATFGVRGVSLGSYAQGAAFIQLARPASGAASGQIEIWGAGVSHCMTTPQPAPPADPEARGGGSSPGCAGIDLAPLVMMPISSN